MEIHGVVPEETELLVSDTNRNLFSIWERHFLFDVSCPDNNSVVIVSGSWLGPRDELPVFVPVILSSGVCTRFTLYAIGLPRLPDLRSAARGA